MLYITYINLEHKGFMGIKKKILAQAHVFAIEFESVYLTSYTGLLFSLMTLDGRVVEKEVAYSKIDCNALLKKWIKKHKIKRTYIRYDYSDQWFIEFLQFQKKNGIISILEIPTFPYDGEPKSPRIALEDTYYRDMLHQYFEVCMTYSDGNKVLGMPVIELMNGVDLESVPLQQKKKKSENGIIRLIAVASMSMWHGYERLLYGLKKYYEEGGRIKIIVSFVGSGTEDGFYHRIVKENHLGDYVCFQGMKYGTDLDEEYNNADIAVGSLGLYKADIYHCAPIKLREFCARGIPFIYAYDDTGFKTVPEYARKFENDDSPICINEIVNLYDEIEKKNISPNDIRTYAEKHFSWEHTMQETVNYYVSKQ